LTTNNGSDTACVTGCLYMRDDGKEGNICVAKPANITIGKKQLKDSYNRLDGCPSYKGLTNDNKVVAGYRYDGVGNWLQELGCNGYMYRLYAGYSESTDDDGFCFPFGSMVVNPGCKVIFFEDVSMITHHTYDQGIYSYVTRDMTFGDYTTDQGISCVSAYLASCDHTYPTCVPTDNWETVVELDNTQSITATTFTYKHTIGTTFSSEIKESIGDSITIKEDVSANFFDLFSASVGVSLTTNYDWTQTDTATKSEATTTEVSQKVRAGKRLSIQQAVGHCGGSTVNTALFKTISG